MMGVDLGREGRSLWGKKGFCALYSWNQEGSKNKVVTGFKCVRIHKSLETWVKKSALHCANTISSHGRGKEQWGRVNILLSWGLNQNVPSVKSSRKLGQATCFCLPVAARVTRQISPFMPPPSFSQLACQQVDSDSDQSESACFPGTSLDILSRSSLERALPYLQEVKPEKIKQNTKRCIFMMTPTCKLQCECSAVKCW